MIVSQKVLLNILIWFVILIIPILPNLWSIWHIFKNDFKTSQDKMTWVLIATFIPVIGGILYIFFGDEKKVISSSISQN